MTVFIRITWSKHPYKGATARHEKYVYGQAWIVRLGRLIVTVGGE